MTTDAKPLGERLLNRLRSTDRGIVLVLVIATIAAWPLLFRASLPTMTDAEMHIYRVQAVQYAIENGEYYIRWAPDFYYGYGYPVFNFYSPLAYYAAAWVSVITGLGVVAGTRAVLLFSVYLGAVGMYLFARDRWRAESGIVAATAWTFAPYILFIDPFARGDVPQTLALATGPLLFWAFDRLRRTASWRYLVLATVMLAMLILSHPLMSLLLYGLLLAFLTWELLVSPLVPRLLTEADQTSPAAYRLIVIGIVLGIALAAFYWLPVGVERSAIKLENVAGGYFDFRNHFHSLTELFAQSPRLDWGATDPEFYFNLGLVQWVLAALGLLTVFVERIRRLDTLFFAFAAVVFLYLMTPASLGVWESLPFMTFFQFPTRFLGPTALVLAPLAGAALRWTELFPGKLARRIATPVAALVLMIGAMPLAYPQPWEDFGPVDRWRMIEVELQGRALGTTSADDFLPVGVDVVPKPADSVIGQYQSEVDPIDRLNRATLPAGAEAELLASGAQYDRYRVSTPVEFVFRPWRFYFPGWTAYVDGEEVPIEIAKPDGFITFWVPPGQHEVLLRLEQTPVRDVAVLISMLAALVLAYAVYQTLDEYRRERVKIETTPLSEGASAFIALGLILFLGFRLLADQAGWFYFDSEDGEVQVADIEYRAMVGDEFELLALDLPRWRMVSSRQLEVTVYWRALRTPAHDYQAFAHLLDEDGNLVAQKDKLNPADFNTRRWPLDEYVRDDYVLPVPDDLPPGRYQVQVGLWNAATGERLPVTLPETGLTSDTVRLPIVINYAP